MSSIDELDQRHKPWVCVVSVWWTRCNNATNDETQRSESEERSSHDIDIVPNNSTQNKPKTHNKKFKKQ
jgi:hypothetical protein